MRNSVSRKREEIMVPQPGPRQYEAIAETKIKEQERIRDLHMYQEDTPRFSRRALILIRLMVMFLIIVGIVIVYHLAR